MTAQTAVIQTLARAVDVLSAALCEAPTPEEFAHKCAAHARSESARRRALDCLSRLRHSDAISGDAAAALHLALSPEAAE